MPPKSGPRGRYPSDEARARPFARIHLTTRTHPTYGHVFANVEMRGMVYGLWQVARGAFAGTTNDTVTLALADVEWITDRTGRHAVARLRKVCAAMDYEMSVLDAHGVVYDERTTECSSRTRPSMRGLRYRVHVRNLQRKQVPYSAISRSTSTRTRTSNEEEEESTRSEDTPRTPSPDADDFARKFRASLKAKTPDAKLPTDAGFDRWILEADRMFRIDGRKPDEAGELAKWLFNDPGDDAAFWRGNVRAVPKFRTRFEELRENRARGARKKEKTDGGRDDALAAGQRYAKRHGLGGLARK